MEKYVKPEIKVENLDNVDVILTSGDVNVEKYYSPIYDNYSGLEDSNNWLTWLG